MWSGASILRALGVLAAGCALLELLLRLALFHAPRSFSALRRAELYANPAQGDEFFWLGHRLRQLSPRTPEWVHPQLGWSQAALHPDNPLGLHASTREQLQDPGPRLVFFGSSILNGRPYKPEHGLVAQLSHCLQRPAVDLSVGGYSPEQILLMMQAFRSRLKQHPDDHWIIGLAASDLERSGTRLQSSFKPYFQLREQRLELKGVPLPTDPWNALRQQTPPIPSYLLAAYGRRWKGRDLPPRAGEVELNRALLQAILDYLEQEKISATLLLFVSRSDLQRPGWQAQLLREVLSHQPLPVYDLGEALRASHLPHEDLFLDNGHLRGLGVRTCCQSIVARMAERGWKVQGCSRSSAEDLRREPLPDSSLELWASLARAKDRGWLLKAPGSPWKSLQANPPAGWNQIACDDAGWRWVAEINRRQGDLWKTRDIWLRSTVELQVPAPALEIKLQHPGPVEIFLDGQPLAQAHSPSHRRWRLLRIAQALPAGRHLLSVHARQFEPGPLEMMVLGVRR